MTLAVYKLGHVYVKEICIKAGTAEAFDDQVRGVPSILLVWLCNDREGERISSTTHKASFALLALLARLHDLSLCDLDFLSG